MTTEVGSGQVAIFPTFKGFRKAVGDETDASAKDSSTGFAKIWNAASSALGRSSGQGFAKTFNDSASTIGSAATKKLQSDVASASRALSTARLKEQDSVGKVRIAESLLADARAKNVDGSSKVVVAEERLASAQRASSAAEDAQAAATLRLTAAQKALADVQPPSSKSFFGNLFSGTATLGSNAGRAIGQGFARTFSAALSPLSGIVAGLIGFQIVEQGIDGLRNAIQKSVQVTSDWSVVQAQTAAFIKSTGGVAGVTADQVHELALNTEELTGTDAKNIQAGANIVGTFANIRNEAGKNNNIYDRTVVAATNMARALGKDVPSAASVLGKALNDPATGLTRLTRIGVTFTAGQTLQIKNLEKTGQLLKAQGIILDAVNAKYGASGEMFRETLPAATAVYDDDLDQLEVKLATGITPAFIGVVNLADKIVNKLRTSSFVDGLVSQIDSYATKLESKIGDVVDLIDTLSKSGQGLSLDGIASGIGNIFPKLRPVLQLATTLAPVLHDVATTLGPTLAKSVAEILPDLGELLKSVSNLVPPLTTIVTKLLPSLSKALTDLTPAITFVLDNGLIPLLTSVDDIFGAFGKGQSFDDFIDKVTKLPGPISFVANSIGFWVDAVVGLIGWLSNLQQSFQNLVTGVIRSEAIVVATLLGIPTTLDKVFAGAETWLLDAGKAIIDGLINGIKSHLGALGTFLATIGTFIVQHKGPPSADAVLLNDNGALIMQSLIAGIQSGKGDLANMLGSVQSKIVSGTSSGGSGPVSSGAAGLPDVVTLVDSDGSIIAKLKVVANQAVAHASSLSTAKLSNGLQMGAL